MKKWNKQRNNEIEKEWNKQRNNEWIQELNQERKRRTRERQTGRHTLKTISIRGESL